MSWNRKTEDLRSLEHFSRSRGISSYRSFNKTCSNPYNHEEFKCSASEKCCGEKCCHDEDFERYITIIVGFLLSVVLGVVCWSIVRGCIPVLRSSINVMSALNSRPEKVTIEVHDQKPLLEECSSGEEPTNQRPNTGLKKITADSHDQLMLEDECSPGEESTNSTTNTGQAKIITGSQHDQQAHHHLTDQKGA